MNRPYLCPACKHNQSSFHLIYKLAQEVKLDPDSGKVLFASDDWESVTRNGRLDLDIRCLVCDYTADEGAFLRAARREEQRALR